MQALFTNLTSSLHQIFPDQIKCHQIERQSVRSFCGTRSCFSQIRYYAIQINQTRRAVLYVDTFSYTLLTIKHNLFSPSAFILEVMMMKPPFLVLLKQHTK